MLKTNEKEREQRLFLFFAQFVAKNTRKVT